MARYKATIRNDEIIELEFEAESEEAANERIESSTHASLMSDPEIDHTFINATYTIEDLLEIE